MAGEDTQRNPIDLFKEWLREAEASEPNDPNAFALATADGEGRPSVRMLLLKGVDDRGFVITKERPYGMTTRAGVFSSGDVVHGPKTVVLAMKESKKVAAGIAQYIDAKKLLAACEE